jgi:asparagine synthase (glutamine-hydrolysing)
VNEKRLKHKKIYFEPEAALNLLNRVVSTQGEPFGSFSVIAQNLIFKEIRENTDTVVLLSGQGGDEILMGYLKYFFFNVKDLFRTYKITEAIKQLLLSSLYGTAVWQFRLGVAKRYIPYLFGKGNTFLKVKSDFEEVWKYKDLRERQILDIDKYSIPALTHYEDRNSMAYSLEVRHPFLDHRIVNFLINVPVSLKLRNGWTKYLLRKAVSDLPPKIRWRRDKQGFLTPEEHWLRTDLKTYISGIFKKSILSEMEIVDSNAFLALYEDFSLKKMGLHYTDISRVFIAEIWARQFFA